MADMIRVNTDLLERCANELKAVAQGFGEAASILARLDTGEEWWEKMGRVSALRLKDVGTSMELGDAGAAVRKLTSVMRSYDDRSAQLGRSVSAAASLFNSVEGVILGRIQAQSAGEDPDTAAHRQTVSDSLITALGYPKDRKQWTEEMRKNYESALESGETLIAADGTVIFVTGTMRIATAANGDVRVTDSKWRELNQKRYGADGSYREETYELAGESMLWKDKAERPKEIYRKKSDNEGPSREQTLFAVSSQHSKSKSLWHKETQLEGENSSLTANVDLMKGTMSSKVEGGLYRTKVDKNGKSVQVLEPGIAAEFGASFSVFEASAKGRVGNDKVGLHGDVTVKGPSGSLQVESQLGIVDGSLSAHAGVSGELIVGEVSGEVGVDLYGVDTKVKGSINYGIGGHADIGVHDGKISWDVGLAVGVGASVKLEVDYGKAVDNVVEGAKQAYNNAVNMVDTIKSYSKGLFSLR